MAISPTISVVIPVHNGERHVDACIASVLAQEFTTYEIVIFDDGSTDTTPAKLTSWASRDGRIKVERSANRLGPVGSSNRVVELASAPLIARLDADDIMLPGRLAAQAAVLTERPDAVLVGSVAWTIDDNGRRVRAPDLARLLRASPFAPFPHSSAMFRQSAWTHIGGYRNEAEKWEDVDFFYRMSTCGAVWVIPLPLVEYRQNSASTRLTDGIEGLENAMDDMANFFDPSSYGTSRRIAAAAYRHIGATILWSGGRPNLLWRIVNKARLRPDLESLGLLGWAALAQVAPGFLRAILRWQLAWRNRTARRQLRNVDPVLWQPVNAR